MDGISGINSATRGQIKYAMLPLLLLRPLAVRIREPAAPSLFITPSLTSYGFLISFTH